MKYFVPNLELAKESNSQTAFQEKLGGLPFGLPVEMYPICNQCKNPMIFLAQFTHDQDRLNLGKDGRNLFVFVCDDEAICESWDADSGANACFVIESEVLNQSETIISESESTLVKELFIKDWVELDDGITEEESLYFFETQKYDEIEFTQFVELLDKTKDYTKLGGVPYWIQHPEIPNGNYKFAGQLDSVNGFEFGDIGIGYIFIEKTENSEQLPKGKFLWQCS